MKPSERREVECDRSFARDRLESGSGTVLLVDDEDLLLAPNAELLGCMGYHVIVAASGYSAVDLFRSKSREIDLVLLDMAMPGMDGRQTFKELKAINPAVKVLFASGFADSEKFKSVIEEGALGLIGKPFNVHELSRKISSILQGEHCGEKVTSSSIGLN